MDEFTSDDSMDRTISACAWLIDMAQRSVDRYGWDHVTVRYLDRLGCGTDILDFLSVRMTIFFELSSSLWRSAMSKRLDNLNRVFLELRDRYGSDDSLVLQVEEELATCQARESIYEETRLPFGERRVAKPSSRFWNVRERRNYRERKAAAQI